jgi:hypothetical protein
LDLYAPVGAEGKGQRENATVAVVALPSNTYASLDEPLAGQSLYSTLDLPGSADVPEAQAGHVYSHPTVRSSHARTTHDLDTYDQPLHVQGRMVAAGAGSSETYDEPLSLRQASAPLFVQGALYEELEEGTEEDAPPTPVGMPPLLAAPFPTAGPALAADRGTSAHGGAVAGAAPQRNGDASDVLALVPQRQRRVLQLAPEAASGADGRSRAASVASVASVAGPRATPGGKVLSAASLAGFYAHISRQSAESMLHGLPAGTYLLRTSSHCPTGFILSVVVADGNRVYHHRVIPGEDGRVWVNDVLVEPVCGTAEEVIGALKVHFLETVGVLLTRSVDQERPNPRLSVSGQEWMHAGVSRERAEALLHDHGLEDVLFLVRPSNQADAALSMAFGGAVSHHLLKQARGTARWQVNRIDLATALGTMGDLILYLHEHVGPKMPGKLRTFVPAETDA